MGGKILPALNNGETMQTKETRMWGEFEVLSSGDGYKIKKLTLLPGKSISLQYHHHRDEHWTVISGTAEVIKGKEKLFISSDAESKSCYIPACCIHRLCNPGKIDLVVVEVQTGEYLEEDDIIRLETYHGSIDKPDSKR